MCWALCPEALDAEATCLQHDSLSPVHAQLLPGDVLVMGSDGLWDNVADNEILDLVLTVSIPDAPTHGHWRSSCWQACLLARPGCPGSSSTMSMMGRCVLVQVNAEQAGPRPMAVAQGLARAAFYNSLDKSACHCA